MEDKLLALLKKSGGYIRMADVVKHGIHRRVLYRMRDQGIILLIKRGLYKLATLPIPPHSDFVEVSRIITKGVITLISALSFYDLTTQIPRVVHVALPAHSWVPNIDYPPTKLHWFSKKYYELGISIIDIEGTYVKIYDKEKTLIDCLRFRNKIGYDIVVEGFKTYCKQPDCDINKLYQYAKACRAINPLKNMLEVILGGES
jgi:predicted transcriptional regulator of viral defense system